MQNPSHSSTSPRLNVADDALFDQHHSRGYHPERPERLAAARRAIERATAHGTERAEVAITLDRLAARDASDDDLAAAHASAYIETMARLAGHHAAIDADTYLAPASVPAARRAAGAAIAMVDAMLAPGGAPIGAALVRPPGHHATHDRAMGFCIFNNVAVAARFALRHGVQRVAIIDWDVHHGNGTQDIFERDGRVLYVSLHEAPLYPGTGLSTETGAGEGAGHTVNIPLSEGATDAVYRLAFEEVVLPVVARFAPELVLVSAGFDAHERDPLASMRLTAAGYGFMASALRGVAEESAKGRIGLVLEGGYDLAAIESSLLASVRGIAGLSASAPSSVDATPLPVAGEAGAVSARHREDVTAARRIAARAWPGV
jgi:acetoin utilization deacetylase AcuC-like enzyme